MTTAQEISRWIVAADFGAKIVYHTGRLCSDADISMYDTPQARELYIVRKILRGAWEDGNVHLFHRRVGENRFEYIAIRRNKRRRALDDRIRAAVKRIMQNASVQYSKV